MSNINIKEWSLKKKIIIIISILLVILMGVLTYFYINNENVANFIDFNILNKQLNDQDISVINLNTEKSNQICVYSKYVAILNDKNLKLYNNYGEQITEISVDINTAIFDSSNKYLAIAEKKGNEICLILDKTYLWSNKIEGEISEIYVNQNGYVAVTTKDSTHKSILTLYNSSGKQLFKSYFSSTRIIDASISSDNKYIAIGELDTTGAIIQSNIKIISVENAQNDSENAIIYTYNADVNKLIISVKYQLNNSIACMYDNSIDIISNNNNNELISLQQNKDISFMSVDFNNNIAYVQDEAKGPFSSNSNVKIVDTASKQEYSYVLEDVAKDIYAQDDILAVNVGTELYFFNTKGRLIKKYMAKQEITNVLLSKNLATVIYKDKVVLISL